jgi:hypothetical protein
MITRSKGSQTLYNLYSLGDKEPNLPDISKDLIAEPDIENSIHNSSEFDLEQGSFFDDSLGLGNHNLNTSPEFDIAQDSFFEDSIGFGNQKTNPVN